MTSITALFKRTVSTFTELASSAPDVFRSTALRTAAVQVGTLPSNLYGWTFKNPNASNVYIKFWNQALIPVIGTDIPVFGPLQVPASGQVVFSGSDIIINFSTLMWIGVTTGENDSDSTPPASNIICTITYKK